ncbi:MAG: PLP-dependent aminotransferase family protein [Achromobacter mucicolens]
MKRYERLTEEITASILSGLLQVGDRLPSVRQTSASRGVSPSTVFKAYYLLEARGLIRARDRSGYYVQRAPRAALPELDSVSSATAGRHPVDVSDNVLRVLNATLRRDMLPFGSAFPSPSFLPHSRLARFMAATVPKLDPWGSIDDLSPGDAALRRAIALRYLADGLTVPVDEIIVTNGALDALNLSLAAVTRPGDAVIVESPTFYAALQSLERNGLHAIEVATHPRVGIDLDALENAILQHRPRACWLMTTFQNPLGSLMPDEKKEALVKLLTRHDVALIEDDVYGELYFGESRPRPAKAFDTEGIVMHCASFSKTLAPGYRVGWVAGGRYTRQIMRNKLTTSLATPAPKQAAIAAYLEKGGFDRHLRLFRQALALQQGELLQAVARYFPKGTRATRPAGGYFVWVELPAHIDTLKVHRAALDQGISIAPGPLFSATGGFGNFLRLNHGHPWNDGMEQGMATLGKLLAR